MNTHNTTNVVPEYGTNNLSHYLIGAFLILSAYLITSYLNDPLRHYPGPFLAKFTNLWRIYHIRQANFHHVMTRLHRQYGPVVRIAPNVLDVDDPAMIKTVFNTKGDWKKVCLSRVGTLFLKVKLINGWVTVRLLQNRKRIRKRACHAQPLFRQ